MREQKVRGWDWGRTKLFPPTLLSRAQRKTTCRGKNVWEQTGKLDKAIKPVVQRTVSRILEESFSATKHFI